MAKLTLTQRETIRRGILKNTFEARRDDLIRRERALATEVILRRYGRDAFARFDALPSGWLPTLKRFGVSYPNHKRSLELAEARSLPAEMYHGAAYELNDALGAKLVALDDAELQLARDREQLDEDVRRTLAAFGTEAQLRDGWPEAHAYLAVPAAATANLPAVRVEDLNRRIAALKEAA